MTRAAIVAPVRTAVGRSGPVSAQLSGGITPA